MTLEALDKWLLDLGMFPTGIAIGVLGFALAWFWPQIWGYFRRYTHNTALFEQQFNDLNYQEARQNFAWGLEKAYRKKHGNDESLKSLLERLNFPKDFPPNKPIGEYAREANFPEDSRKIWEFFKEMFRSALDSRDQELLDESEYKEFHAARRITSKFWDNYARLISQRKLRYEDIKRPIEANILGIKALALSELALAYQFSWDPGPGKMQLFKLALDPNSLGKR